MTGLAHALLTWLSGGSALAALISTSATVCALIFGLIYRRYVGILGADRKRPAERRAYDALRNSLSGGNLAARLYARSLTRFLRAVDRFFGDAGWADRSLFPRAFGLRTPAPLWTAPAFDRCLLLAFIYPIVTIFVIWAVSGHVGPAEAALRLQPGLLGWRRGLVVAAFALMTTAIFRSTRPDHLASELAWSAVAVAVTVTVVVAGVADFLAVAFAAAFAVAVARATAYFRSRAVAIPGTDALVRARVRTIALSGAVAVAVALALAVAVVAEGLAEGVAVVVVVVAANFVGAVVFIPVAWANLTAANRGRQGVFLSFFFVMMIVASVAAARLLSPLRGWEVAGPLLLFLGLLTLLNAPFDWASLGLTRALLRRGLELGGWAPYFLALVDAALAAGVIVALTLVMVIGVQTFDELAVQGGGKAILPLDALFDGIAANPLAAEYWWLYALLISSMIPSLINLVIGGTSLLRGLPGLPSLLLRKIPAQGNVLKWDRAWIATVLTAQVAAGAALGMTAQAFLAVVIIGYIMPFFGLELLDMARGVAALNLPIRASQLFMHLP